MFFLLALSRILNCPKVHVATAGLVTTWFAVRYATIDLPPTQRASLWVAFIAAVAIELREIINAWTAEDAMRVQGRVEGSGERVQSSGFGVQEEESPSTTPRIVQLNTALAPVPQRPPSQPRPASLNPELRTLNPPSATQSSVLKPRSLLRRSAAMPPRTKLPMLLIAIIPALALLNACQPNADLTVYREGLHAVDEPLYQAHLLLMNDAVGAGIRTDADRQVVQQGINAARALYQQSAAAATQPSL
jgi:hypothetical protein